MDGQSRACQGPSQRGSDVLTIQGCCQHQLCHIYNYHPSAAASPREDVNAEETLAKLRIEEHQLKDFLLSLEMKLESTNRSKQQVEEQNKNAHGDLSSEVDEKHMHC